MSSPRRAPYCTSRCLPRANLRRCANWLIFLCVYSLAALSATAAAAEQPAPAVTTPPATPAVTPPPADTGAASEAAGPDAEPAPPAPLDPPIQFGTPPGYGAPATDRDLTLDTPYTQGLAFPASSAGRWHPYAGLRFQSRSNVFYKTNRVDPVTLEALDLGLHFTTASAPPPAATTTPATPATAATPATEEDHAPAASHLTADYNARFEIFNRFHQLNDIQQHAFLSAGASASDIAFSLVDRLGTAHDPDTVELATLVNREIRRFYHHLDLGLYDPRSVGADPDSGRLSIAATVDNGRYAGTALNAVETDAYGLQVAWTQPQTLLPLATDPVIFKFSAQGFTHPRKLLNELVIFQALVKLGGPLSTPPFDPIHPTSAAPWDFELVFGCAAIDVQTDFQGAVQKQRGAVVPVAAFQIDGDLNTRQSLHFRFNAVHEPDVSLTSNYLRRTRLAATLTQRLGDAYTWELAAAEEWADPSQGPTLAQFTCQGELRWTKELPNLYLGPHAPVFFRIETRSINTVERNRTGVHTWSDVRLTLGWASAL